MPSSFSTRTDYTYVPIQYTISIFFIVYFQSPYPRINITNLEGGSAENPPGHRQVGADRNGGQTTLPRHSG